MCLCTNVNLCVHLCTHVNVCSENGYGYVHLSVFTCECECLSIGPFVNLDIFVNIDKF